MKFEERQALAAPWDTVRKMFTDPAYFEKKAKMLKRMDVKMLGFETSGDEFKIRFSFDEKPGIELPGFARRFVGKTAHIIEEDRWNLKTRSGRLTLELQGLPVKLYADMNIRDTEGGCVNVLNWNVSCSVPLLGGKLEKLIAQDVQARASEDHAASSRLLKKY